jgi:hypothetical protein
MGVRFKPVSSEDANPGEVQATGRIDSTQTKEMAPDARRKTHTPMKKNFFTDVNRFS